jgi:hypothetical protein
MLNMTDALKMGVEIEGIFNLCNFALIKTNKENNNFFKTQNFILKDDGSLERSGIFENEISAEITTKKPVNPNKLKRNFKSFEKAFKGLELNEVVYFNKTCGLHYHFSINDKNNIHEIITLKTIRKTRQYFFKQLRQSEILKDCAESIIIHYNRKYATLNKINKFNGYKNVKYELCPQYIKYDYCNLKPKSCDKKYKEFNFISEINGYGVEWRSLNAYGVKTWVEFHELNNIIIDSILFLIAQIKQPQKEIINIRLDKPNFNSNKEVIYFI